MPMTIPLPVEGDTSWYDWATEIHGDVDASIPTVTTFANLGATQTINFASAASEQWLTGSLNANLAVTISNPIAGSRFVLLATQDGTGNRTVTIAGTVVDVPKAAGAQVVVVGRWRDASTFSLESSGVQKESLVIPASSDLTTVITTGAAKYRFPMPFDFIPTETLGDLVTSSSSGLPTFDINDDGVSIYSTRPSFDVSETTLATAATPSVISSTLIAKGSIVTVDCDTAGTGAVGPTLVLNGLRVL